MKKLDNNDIVFTQEEYKRILRYLDEFKKDISDDTKDFWLRKIEKALYRYDYEEIR